MFSRFFYYYISSPIPESFIALLLHEGTRFSFQSPLLLTFPHLFIYSSSVCPKSSESEDDIWYPENLASEIWHPKSKIRLDKKSSRAARIPSGSPLEGVWSSFGVPALDIESRWDADFDFGSPNSQKSPKSDPGFGGFLGFWRSKIVVAIPSGLDIKSRAARRASDTF